MKKNLLQGRDRRRFLKASSAKTLKARATSGVPAKTSARSKPGTTKKDVGEKIDIFCHILPSKSKEALFKKATIMSLYRNGQRQTGTV